jgi:hypothetical protein
MTSFKEYATAYVYDKLTDVFRDFTGNQLKEFSLSLKILY